MNLAATVTYRKIPRIVYLSLQATLVIALLLIVGFQSAHAGGGPENVMVVVNSESQSSKLIANHYIAMRKIPGRNVVYLNDIPFKERMQFDSFESKILRPVLSAIEDRKLAGSIDYIVYSADFPTLIDIPKVQKQAFENAEAGGIRVDDRFKRGFFPGASISSLTFLAGECIHSPADIVSLRNNHYCRIPTTEMLQRPFVGAAQKEFQRSIEAFEKSPEDPLFESAYSSLGRMAKKNPGQTAVLYWLAKFAAKQGNETDATRFMTRAVGMGWSDRSGTSIDPDFSNISDPVFKGIVKRMSNFGRRETASRAFRQIYQWAPNGMQNRTPGQGKRYFLSTVLAVTRNEGNSEDEAIRQLQRSVAADFSKPLGTFYFSSTNDVRSKARSRKFQATVNALQDLGFQAKIIRTDLPEDQSDVIGLSTGTPRYSWKDSGSSIVPGAICENFTSYGGRLGDPRGQTPLSEFLRYGAAGSSGTVIEPLSIAAKFPNPMIHVHYARGCSLAESFYQSIHGPFQTLIVGDALCQPFAIPPKVKVSGLSPMDVVSGKMQLVFDAEESPVRVAGIELYVDGILRKRDGSLDPIDLNTNLLNDGYHELRVVFVAANQIETSSRSIIPLTINNQQQNCELGSENPACGIDDLIKLNIESEGAEQIQIFQHQKLLTTLEGAAAEYEIAAKELGRGPTTLRAIATIGEKQISSRPLQVMVNGPLLETRPQTGTNPP